jgi:cobalt-zinc-cadmium efflux system membrane fusion protein
MILRIRSLTRGVASHVPTILSLVFFGGVAAWGALHHWQAPHLSFATRAGAAEESEASVGIAVTEDASPGLVAGCAWQAAFPHAGRSIVFPSAEAVEKAGLQVIAAQELPMTDCVSANGMIDYDPTTYAHIATRAPGTVWWVGKQIGEPARKGEVLALVESAEVGKTKVDFLTNLTDFDLRSKVLQRMQQAGIAVAERALREAEASTQQARIRLFGDQQALLNLGLVVRIDDLLKKTDEQRVRELRLVGLPPQLASSPSADTLTANLLPVVAPFDGQIVQRNAAIGEAVTSLKPLFIVADLRHVHLEMAVDPGDAGRLRVGLPVTFSLRVDGIAPATGTLAHIGPEVDEKTRKVWVHAEAENPDGRLRPHSFGDGRILVHDLPHAVVVPQDSIQMDGHHHLVFVRRPQANEFLVRHVRPGLRSGDRVEVAGVWPGEEVVTGGSHALLSELLKDRLGEAD